MIIGAPILDDMHSRIHVYHQTFPIKKNGKPEALNIVYEPETWDGSDNELMTDSETLSENFQINKTIEHM